MAEPLLDVPALLQPIPGDDPAGLPMSYALRDELDRDRREFEPHPDDPTQPPVARDVNWAGIVEKTRGLLTNRSKDLRIAVRLVEALVRRHGFEAVPAGLELLRGLVADCWDRLHPVAEEGEGLEARATPFDWLTIPDRGACFPFTLRKLPAVMIDGARCSFHDWKLAQEGIGPVSAGDFARAVPASPELLGQLEQSVAALNDLDAALGERMGNEAPGLQGLRQALDDCRRLVQQAARNVPGGAAQAEAASPGAGNGIPVAAAEVLPGKVPTTRDEVYRQLGLLADVLERLEPHSPIPDLLRRAVELGKMPFRLLVRELIRDDNLLAQVSREFGIQNKTEGEGAG